MTGRGWGSAGDRVLVCQDQVCVCEGGGGSGAAPPTSAPEASPGETRGEVLCCTKSGRLVLPGNRLALPGKPLLAVELRLRSLCFCRKRERGGLLRSEAVIDRSGDGGRKLNPAVCGCVCFCVFYEEDGWVLIPEAFNRINMLS